MPGFAAKDANRRGNSRVVGLRGLAGAALAAAFLPGCPLSDSYYIDANGTAGHTAANGGDTAVGGGAGVGGSGGNAALGGSDPGAGAAGEAGGPATGGSAGDAAS